jgi:hypothetical protein
MLYFSPLCGLKVNLDEIIERRSIAYKSSHSNLQEEKDDKGTLVKLL